MISERHKGAVAIHTVFQVLAVSLSFFAWYLFITIFDIRGLAGGFLGYSTYGSLAVLALLGRTTYRAGQDGAILSGLFWGRLKLAARQTVFIGTVIVFFLVVTKDRDISRVFLFSWLPILYVTLCLTNLATPHLVMPLVFAEGHRQKFLLITRSRDVFQKERLIEWLQRQRRMGIRVIGISGPSEIQAIDSDIPFLGSTDEISQILRQQSPDVLLCLEPPGDQSEVNQWLALAEKRGARLIFWDDLNRRFGMRAWSAEVDGLNFVHFRREPLESPFNRVVKRAFDLAISGFAVGVIMPLLCALVWLLHRLQSPGPLFFRQTRRGIGGGEFRIFKFRTMHAGNENDKRQTSRGDERIFPAAHWLRRTSLDEIPQFLNVLRGEMSVVGPRPHIPEHDEQWSRILNAYHVRTVAKPGITGLAQVRGMRGEAKSDEDVLKRIESDLEYIENYTPLVDLTIVAQTALQVLFPKNTAY
jgi:exopolysaccharide biosynthesis polyprenyl glycosylphosphotransferase